MLQSLNYMLPLVRPIRTKEQLNEVAEKARSMNHHIITPSHMMIKEGEIVGYASCGSPTVWTWQHETKVNVRDSLHVLGVAEGIMSHLGHNLMIFPCSLNSPYHKVMGKLGYNNVGNFDIFVKNL